MNGVEEHEGDAENFVEEYELLDKQLDSLDTVLTVLEERRDHLHEEIRKLLEEAKQARLEQEKEQQEQEKASKDPDSKSKYLAESNGRVLLDTLSRHWPDDDNLPPHLPKDCMAYWRLSTSQDGSLTWKGFSSALMEAFMGDRHRLSGESRKAEEPGPVGVFTTTKDIEDELASCSKDRIASALARTRKEVYKSQKSINNFTSPRKETNTGGNHPILNASHQMRDEVILQQLEDLLRDRIKEQSTTVGGGMVDEVLRQLRSLLMSSRVGAHDQLQYNNPYATIRRGSAPISKGGNKTARHFISDQMLIGQPVNRSLSMPGSRPLNILPEPPPPYSVAAPPQQLYSSKRNSASMSNLRPQQPPTMGPTHANSTRQLLHVWKEANISTAGARKAPSAHIRPYVSSPDLSQEELQFTSEELRQAEMYGTITRRKSNKRSSAQHQQQVMTSSRTDMLLDPPLPPSSRQPAAAPEKQTVQPHSTPSK